MRARNSLGFTAEDRKVLTQLPVQLSAITDAISKLGTRTEHIEEHKADRKELRDLEHLIVDRLDELRGGVSKLDKEKGDAEDINDHEERLRILEQWRWKTIGYATGCSTVAAIIIKLIFK